MVLPQPAVVVRILCNLFLKRFETCIMFLLGTASLKGKNVEEKMWCYLARQDCTVSICPLLYGLATSCAYKDGGGTIFHSILAGAHLSKSNSRINISSKI